MYYLHDYEVLEAMMSSSFSFVRLSDSEETRRTTRD